MVKSKHLFPAGGEPLPIAQSYLQQRECTNDIGLNKCSRTVDRAVYVAFSRQMHDDVRMEGFYDIAHLAGIDDVSADEGISRTVRDRRQRFQIAGICQLVNNQNRMLVAPDGVANDG